MKLDFYVIVEDPLKGMGQVLLRSVQLHIDMYGKYGCYDTDVLIVQMTLTLQLLSLIYAMRIELVPDSFNEETISTIDYMKINSCQDFRYRGIDYYYRLSENRFLFVIINYRCLHLEFL